MSNIFRIGDTVTLKANPNKEIGLVKEINDTQCAVCWWNVTTASYMRASWVPSDQLTLSSV